MTSQLLNNIKVSSFILNWDKTAITYIPVGYGEAEIKAMDNKIYNDGQIIAVANVI